MAEAAQGRAFYRLRTRRVRIILHHPVETVRLVRFLVDIETVLIAGPAEFVAQLAIPGALEEGRIGHLRHVAAEPAGRTLFAEQHRAPGRGAAGTIVQGAQHLGARGIGRGLQQLVAGGGAGQLDRRVGGDAAVVGAISHHLPLAAGLLDLDHRMAVSGHGDLGLVLVELRRHVILGQTWPHDVGIDIFVVDAEQAVVGAVGAHRQRHEADEVAVVAELLFLGAAGHGRGLEGAGARHDRIAPAQQHLFAVAGGDMVLFVIDARQFAECQRRRSGGGGTRAEDAAAEHAEAGGSAHAQEGRAPGQPIGDHGLDRRRGRAAGIGRVGRVVSHGLAHRKSPYLLC